MRRTFRGKWKGIDLHHQTEIDASLDRLENFFPKRVVDALKELRKQSHYLIKIKRTVTYQIETLGPYERFDYKDEYDWPNVVPYEELIKARESVGRSDPTEL